MPGDGEFAEFEHNDQTAVRGTASDSDAGRTPASGAEDGASDDALLPAVTPQQGHFGFTLRELIIGGAWLLAFALSFVPGAGSILDITSTVWTMNGAWLLSIGVPTVATFLVVLRRLSPEGIRRVGSLGIDQFASVAYTVAAVSWAVLLWQQLALVAATRQSLLVTWAAWAELVLMLVLVVVTVFAGLIPGLREDFEGRMETIAHRNADPVRPVVSRPRPVRARGSVADTEPAHEAHAEHDPDREHEAELGAAGHVSAGTSVAPDLGSAGYVPMRRRGSFLASDENPDDVPALDVSAGRDQDDVMAEGGAAPDEMSLEAPDAQTEVFTAAILDEDAEPAAPVIVSSRRDAERRTPDVDDGSDARAQSSPDGQRSTDAQPVTDTLTQVLGDLLEPSDDAVTDDVATHAVPVMPDREASDARASDARSASDARGQSDAERRTEAHPVIRGSEQAQPFWALAPDVREVHDARGDEIFEIGPDAWILVLEDRGGAFVVRHDDGRVGYLHDTDNMTRG